MSLPAERAAVYKAVIASKRWRDLRVRLMRQRGERCERCGKTWAPGYKATLQLHHKTYERLGGEYDSDLQLVCEACHETADIERAIEARVRAKDALYEAQLDGWARKKYGDDYIRTLEDQDQIEEEFEEWLERRSE